MEQSIEQKLIPLPPYESPIKDRDLFGFESSFQTIMEAHLELRNMVTAQQPQINQLEESTTALKDTVQQAEKDLVKANEHGDKSRKWNIISGATAGVLLTGVIAGPQIAIPLALASSAFGYYLFRK